MTDYKIYRIVDNTTGLVYIGMTRRSVEQRLGGHIDGYRRYKRTRGKSPYISSFEVLKNNNYSIHLIENHPCADERDVIKRESELIWLSPNCINLVGNSGYVILTTRSSYDGVPREDYLMTHCVRRVKSYLDNHGLSKVDD